MNVDTRTAKKRSRRKLNFSLSKRAVCKGRRGRKENASRRQNTPIAHHLPRASSEAALVAASEKKKLKKPTSALSLRQIVGNLDAEGSNWTMIVILAVSDL